MADIYNHNVSSTEYKCLTSPKNTYAVARIYAIPNAKIVNKNTTTGISTHIGFGNMRNTQTTATNAIDEYRKFTTAVYTLAKIKICIGNLTFINIKRLSTNDVIAEFVEPVNKFHKILPHK